MKYYYLSTKWTFPDEAAFVFWGKNYCGYVHNIDNAGLYDEENNSDGVISIPEKLIKKLVSNVIFETKKSKFVLNKPWIRKKIGINIFMLNGGMSKLKSNHFDVLSMPKDYKQIRPEKTKTIFTRNWHCKAKDTYDEYWHYNDIIEAPTRTRAIYEAMTLWDWDRWGEDYIENKKHVSCRKEIKIIFAGWE